MSRIRAAERDDLPQVVELYERAMRSGRPGAPPGLAPYFERTLFEQPWADPELPSMLYEADDGRILGFIGSHVRRLQFDGRPIRMRCAGQLVSDPDQRRLAVGARLLRSYLSGPQELTITDGATHVVREMWVGLGGHVLHPGSTVWTRFLRPFQALGERWLEHRGAERPLAVARPVLSLLDAATSRFTRPAESDPTIDAQELTASALIEHRDQASGGARLRVDYDERFVGWLFDELAQVRTRGTPVRRLLLRDGRPLGWYVAFLEPGRWGQVLAIAARRGAADSVIDRLFADAWQNGAVALEGRVDAELYWPMHERLGGPRGLLRHGTASLFHTHDPELAAVIARGESGLTRLDGEWWMGHHTEPFT